MNAAGNWNDKPHAPKRFGQTPKAVAEAVGVCPRMVRKCVD